MNSVMRKNKIYVMGLIVLSAMVFLNVYVSLRSNSIELSEFTLENIEALAENEGSGGNTCTVIGYKEIWSQGCLYNCAQCAEGHFVVVSTIDCLAR